MGQAVATGSYSDHSTGKLITYCGNIALKNRDKFLKKARTAMAREKTKRQIDN